MKTSEKMTKKKWENSSNTWFLSNAYLGEHHREFWASLYHSFHNLNPAYITTHEWRPPWSVASCRHILSSNIIFSWIKKEKCLIFSNPTRWYVEGQNFSNSQIPKWLKRTFKIGALSLFAPNNVIPKYYHISFLDCLWKHNLTMFKRKKQILITWV